MRNRISNFKVYPEPFSDISEKFPLYQTSSILLVIIILQQLYCLSVKTSTVELVSTIFY